MGEILAATSEPRLAYVWEPFSLEVRRGICDARFRRWFTYICDDNADHFRGAIADTLAFRYRPLAELPSLRGPKDVARMARDWWRTSRYRRSGAVAVMKDPIAIFSSRWLVTAFHMDPVVMIRHPAAFVNSVVSKGWRHPFEHFIDQPLLMRDHLAGFEGELRRFAASEQPLF